LWRLKAPGADEAIKEAASVAAKLPSRYIPLQLVLCDRQRALPLGLTMLSAANSPPEQREDRSNVRVCGALTIALAAETDRDKAEAVLRIRNALENENDFYVRSAYHSALLILNQSQSLPFVRDLLDTENYPWSEPILALTVSGNRLGLDSLLYGLDDEDLAFTLVNMSALDVLNAVEGLAPVDWACLGDLQIWEMHIARCAYGVRRSAPMVLEFNRGR
jgi:hypothetical protein